MKPRRSILSVPGHIEKMHHKAVASDVDVIMFDLEDSVPVSEKHIAREKVMQSLSSLEFGSKTVTVRVNGVDTPFCYQDIIAVASLTEGGIDSLVLPKINNAAEVHFADILLNQVEASAENKNTIGLEASIESAEGLNEVSSIAAASTRLKTLVFGIADYSSSIGARLVSISGHGENEEEIYPGHRWHFVHSRMVMAAKANGLMVIDAPYGNFKDDEGLTKSAGMAAALGFDGKWAIHPNQIPVINKVFSPSTEEIERALTIINALNAAALVGKGAVTIEGRMVDRATVRLAQKTYDTAKFLRLV